MCLDTRCNLQSWCFSGISFHLVCHFCSFPFEDPLGGLIIKITPWFPYSLWTFSSFISNEIQVLRAAKIWAFSVHLWTSWPHFVRLWKSLNNYIIWNLWLIQKPRKYISKTDKPHLFVNKAAHLAGISVCEAQAWLNTNTDLFWSSLFLFPSNVLKVSRFSLRQKENNFRVYIYTSVFLINWFWFLFFNLYKLIMSFWCLTIICLPTTLMSERRKSSVALSQGQALRVHVTCFF